MQNGLGADRPLAVNEEIDARHSEGWQHLQQGDPVAACQAFRQVLQSGLAKFARGTGRKDLHGTLLQAVLGLGDCLPALVLRHEARHDALEALFHAFQADVGRGANGIAKEASFTMLRHAGAEERLELTAWVRRALATASGEVAVQHWRLLLDLEALDPAALEPAFAQCRAAGHAGLVAEKLLDLDRVGDALTVARRELQSAEEWLRFAQSPAAQGQASVVMALIEERLKRAFDPALAEWLASRRAERGDLPRALDLRLRLLRAAPTEGNYEAVYELARRVGRWEQLQPQVERVLQR